MVGQEIEKMDLNNTFQKCGCEGKREIWDWALDLECACLVSLGWESLSICMSEGQGQI